MSHKWLNETLEAKVGTILSFTRLDFLVRPKVTYALTDRWKVVMGADIFRGQRRSFFGRLQDNSAVYARSAGPSERPLWHSADAICQIWRRSQK